MSYRGATPTKFGQYRVAEPLRFDRLHLHKGEPLHEVDHAIPIPVLDQEDLTGQGIFTDELIPGAARVDALGSCTANASMASLAERLAAAGRSLETAKLSATDAAACEKTVILFYHATTSQTGDPSQEYPPSDCGSTGLYCCTELERQKLIGSYKTATGAQNLLSLLQAGTVIAGGPWFNSWMDADSDGFVDGDGSYDAFQAAVGSGVAGGHETCYRAIPQLAVTSAGAVDLQRTVIESRNSWSASYALSGDYRLHASTINWLAGQYDFKQFVI